jgi:hypothetical protein
MIYLPPSSYFGFNLFIAELNKYPEEKYWDHRINVMTWKIYLKFDTHAVIGAEEGRRDFV